MLNDRSRIDARFRRERMGGVGTVVIKRLPACRTVFNECLRGGVPVLEKYPRQSPLRAVRARYILNRHSGGSRRVFVSAAPPDRCSIAVLHPKCKFVELTPPYSSFPNRTTDDARNILTPGRYRCTRNLHCGSGIPLRAGSRLSAGSSMTPAAAGRCTWPDRCRPAAPTRHAPSHGSFQVSPRPRIS